MFSFLKDIHFKSWRYIAQLLGFPFLVVALLGWTLMPFIKGYLKEVIAFGLLTFICFGIIVLIKQKSVRKALILIFYVVLALLALAKLSFYYHYNVKISSSALFVIFETNAAESSDFMANYLNGVVLGFAAILFLPLMFSNKLINSKHIDQGFLKSIASKSFLAIVICLSVYLIHKKFSHENILLTSLNSYENYQLTKQTLKAQLAQPTSKALQNVSSSNDAQTHVVIIGEATSNWHMQLYGYHRETNPALSEIRDELLVFDSVITPHVHTILALQKIFTLTNYDTADLENNGSIVQLANQAGYETYWISNQKPVGLHESIPTLIGSAAKHKQFLATDDYTYDIYDEAVLPTLHTVLQEEPKKKLIFIHLIGAHAAYKYRYPKAFEYFRDDTIKTKFKHDQAIETVNHYDNAIRYNDHIVRQIIEQVRAQNTNSYVTYFSDHGDEVFDTMDLEGHNEYHATRPMYEVPFIVWLSDAYKLKHPEILQIRELTKRRYNLEDFIYSFSSLSDIQFKDMDETRSIFDSSFIKRPRLIKKGEDYDKR